MKAFLFAALCIALLSSAAWAEVDLGRFYVVAFAQNAQVGLRWVTLTESHNQEFVLHFEADSLNLFYDYANGGGNRSEPRSYFRGYIFDFPPELPWTIYCTFSWVDTAENMESLSRFPIFQWPGMIQTFTATPAADAVLISATMLWEDIDLFTGYRITRAMGDNPLDSTIATFSTMQGSYVFVDTTAMAQETYHYRFLSAISYWNEWGIPAFVDLQLAEDSTQVPEAVSPNNPALPSAFSLSAYPNPFNPATIISFSLPSESNIALDIFDGSGRQIASLARGRLDAGTHQVRFDGRGLPSGIYFAKLDAGTVTETQKLVLLK